MATVGKDRIVILNIPDKSWDTPQLATELEYWGLSGRNVSLSIGGPEGLSPVCKAAAEQSLSPIHTSEPMRRERG